MEQNTQQNSILNENNNLSNQQNSVSSKTQLINERELDEQTILEYITILKQHLKNCAQNERFVEAQMAKERISELKEEYSRKILITLLENHEQEKTEVEEAHLNEFNLFNQFWDQKMEEFNNQANEIEQNMQKRHQQEIEDLIVEIDDALPKEPKESAELINLKKIQDTLALNENFVEAHQITIKRNQLLEKQVEVFQKERQKKITNMIKNFQTKQKNELNALFKRIDQGQEEQRKVRSLELERLLQKYQNVKNELENQQQSEISKLKQAIKTDAHLNSQKMPTLSSQVIKSSIFNSAKKGKFTSIHK